MVFSHQEVVCVDMDVIYIHLEVTCGCLEIIYGTTRYDLWISEDGLWTPGDTCGRMEVVYGHM